MCKKKRRIIWAAEKYLAIVLSTSNNERNDNISNMQTFVCLNWLRYGPCAFFLRTRRSQIICTFVKRNGLSSLNFDLPQPLQFSGRLPNSDRTVICCHLSLAELSPRVADCCHGRQVLHTYQLIAWTRYRDCVRFSYMFSMWPVLRGAGESAWQDGECKPGRQGGSEGPS